MSNTKYDRLDMVKSDLESLADEFNYAHQGVNGCIAILMDGVPSSKQDYMDAVLNMDRRIRVIDSAVPIQVYSPIQKLGVNTDGYVTVYYKDVGQGSTSEVLDIFSRWAILNNNR